MAGKIGRMKKKCERYKNAGTRGINKAEKQKKHEKRIAKFTQRKEEGKCYEYKPNPYNKDGSRKEQFEFRQERRKREAKNVDHRLPLQKLTSMMRLLENEQSKQREAIKAALKAKENRATKGKRKESVDE